MVSRHSGKPTTKKNTSTGLHDIRAMLKDRTYKDKLLNAQTPIELCQIIGAWQAPDDDAEQTSEQN